MERLQQIKELGKTTREKQSFISTGEAWHLWSLLAERYSVQLTTKIFSNFVQTSEFKLILERGEVIIDEEIQLLEQALLNYGIPLPNRTPAGVHTNSDSEIITDKFIFERVFVGLRDFMPQFLHAYIAAENGKIREMLKGFLINEIELYDQMLEYGRLKNWLRDAPRYRSE
ncbi:MAG: DUF3231 family protein [Limnochordia bacterium]